MDTLSHAASFVPLVYADIFDYPLTSEETLLWAFGKKIFPKETPRIQKQNGYYFLDGKHHVVSIRKKRSIYAREKWRTAERIGSLLRIIPTIELVGVTGALSMNNAKEDDDIDLFFIVSPGTLWISRLLATIITEILGVRRRPGDTNIENKICLNMFMTSDHVKLPKKEQDLFLAHEVLQMVPLWDRGMYQKFIKTNAWVKKFLPNAWEEKVNSKWKIENRKTHALLLSIYYFLEPAAKSVQLAYMKNRRTTEIISDTVIRFHPRDARVWIKQKLARRLEHYKIPLDKIFYAR